jgi:hypothetical protein
MHLNKTIWLCFISSCLITTLSSGQTRQSDGTTGFAIVELFTSEGCSSCPAAETALARIHDEYPQNVYVLEFHVDYWNYIGWNDVFSSAAYTKRQQEYAQIFSQGST